MSNKNEVFEYLIDQLRQQVGSNPYKQQCEDLAHEVLSLKNQLRDASAREAELQKALNLLGRQVSVLVNKFPHEPEQSGCRKDDTQECRHDFEYIYPESGAHRHCIKCGAITE